MAKQFLARVQYDPDIVIPLGSGPILQFRKGRLFSQKDWAYSQ